MAKILTVYFSLKGQTIAPGMKIINLKKGNTAVAAEYIQKAVCGEIFEIETVKTYIEDHFEMIEEAKKEFNNKTRVEVKNYLDNLEDYDVIFLGYPNWWNTIPMVVVTFLEHYNLAGKRIIPFCTNEGSGLGNSVTDLKKICKGAVVEEGISIRGSQAINSEKMIAEWAKKMI